jgi:hypothetical protein
VTIITVVALLLAFLAGLVSDVLPMYANQRNLDWIAALTSGDFWDFFYHALSNNPGNVAVQLGLALVFGALGCFSVLRTAFVQTRAVDAAAGTASTAPAAGTAPSIPSPETDPNADKRE